MIKRPESCSSCGSYECSVPMALNGRVHSIDLCLAHIVAALNAGGIETRASCCGHGTQDGSIVLADGRELVVRKYQEGSPTAREEPLVRNAGGELSPRSAEKKDQKPEMNCDGIFFVEKGERMYIPGHGYITILEEQTFWKKLLSIFGF